MIITEQDQARLETIRSNRSIIIDKMMGMRQVLTFEQLLMLGQLLVSAEEIELTQLTPVESSEEFVRRWQEQMEAIYRQGAVADGTDNAAERSC